MKRGYLAEMFDGVAVKELSAVETEPGTSNQHEFNGARSLEALLGRPTSKERFPATFVLLSDDEEEAASESGLLTWYDARRKGREEGKHNRKELRLYYTANGVMATARSGDLLIVALRPDSPILVIVARAGSTAASQVLWLFGCQAPTGPDFEVQPELDLGIDAKGLAARNVLESLGIQVDISDDSWLDGLLERFGSAFPGTREFSAYARGTLPDVSAGDDPDSALMEWMEREEMLFRTLERHIVGERLRIGFGDDVDEFIALSLSVQNRRKSRAGHALENHLEHMFIELGIPHSRNPQTENRSRPDFLFPGAAEYHDPGFDSALLFMLGVKTSCKERWRQVLPEADRIARKHLLTLESPISAAQTDEMRSHDLQLVVPAALHGPYSRKQQEWLMQIQDFVRVVRAN